MGAWGSGSFENDTALDWAGGVESVADVRESALSVSGIVHTPLWVGFEAFGKFGVAYTRLNDDLGHKWQPVIGAGLDYSLTKAISLRGQVLYTHNFANTDSHVVNTSIGAAYRF